MSIKSNCSDCKYLIRELKEDGIWIEGINWNKCKKVTSIGTNPKPYQHSKGDCKYYDNIPDKPLDSITQKIIGLILIILISIFLII